MTEYRITVRRIAHQVSEDIWIEADDRAIAEEQAILRAKSLRNVVDWYTADDECYDIEDVTVTERENT